MARVGGTGAEAEATEEIAAICEGVREAAQAHSDQPFTQFTAVRFTQQVVAGTNYFVKVQTGDASFAHVRVHKPLPHTGAPPSVASIKLGQTADSPIEYF